MKRLISMLMAALTMTTVFVGCASADSSSDSTESAETSAVETTEAGPTSGLPAGLDFDGFEVRVLHSADKMFTASDSGDVVDSAVIKRNSELSEKLNIKIRVMADLDVTEHSEALKNAVLSGSDDYNMVSGMTYGISPYVPENYFHNLLSLEYANYDAEWWAGDFMKEAVIGNNALYIASGDISISKISYQSCIYFNKQVYENYKGDPNEFYKQIYDGNWTLDDMAKLSAGMYSDLNGDGNKDTNDQLAMILHCANLTDHIAYDTGFRATERDSDGVPYLVLDSERNTTFVQKLYDLYYNNDGTITVPNEKAAEANNTIVPTKFKNNELLFMLGWFYSASKLRDMEGDYGIIPFPKYDETQDKYLSLIHDSALVTVIPATVSAEDADILSAVMEEMAFLGWRDVTPVYYEVALKVKYIRDSDDISLRLVDMIHDGATTDFAYINNKAMGGAGLIMRDLMFNKNADIASYYANKESIYQSSLDGIIEMFAGMN